MDPWNVIKIYVCMYLLMLQLQAVLTVCDLSDVRKCGMKMDIFHNITRLHLILPQLYKDCLKRQLQY
jgi:hypothetical protein